MTLTRLLDRLRPKPPHPSSIVTCGRCDLAATPTYGGDLPEWLWQHRHDGISYLNFDSRPERLASW